MKVLIIGAHGKIGKKICQKMNRSAKYKPTAFIRKEEQRNYFEKMGIEVVVESLENSPEAIGHVIQNYDAVVFTAGSGGNTGADKTIEIDLDGAIKAIQAAVQHQLKRFVMVSASQTDNRSFWDKAEGMKPYYIAKHYADMELKRSRLDYTILRPTLLTDDGEGKVLMTLDASEVGAKIPRETVASSVLAVLDNPKTSGKIIEMSEGEDEITEAIEKVCS